MKIGFFINDIQTEKAGYTTLRLALTAVNRGHEVWIIGAGGLAYEVDERIRAWAWSAIGKKYKTTESFLKELKGTRARVERITVDNLDILMLRNDPARDKMYMQLLPQHIRPRTLISYERKEIKAFVDDLGGAAVLKGFQGSSSQAVFLVTRENRDNLNQMIDAIVNYGYVIAQEYLPGAEHGSVRLFLVNGEPLHYRGKVAAFQWVRTED